MIRPTALSGWVQPPDKVSDKVSDKARERRSQLQSLFSPLPPVKSFGFAFGSIVPDQTNSTLVFSNISTLDSAIYQVEITNPYGTTASAEVEVNVLETEPPTINQDPVSITRYAGTSGALTVEATGGASLQYQWQRGESDVPGATGASLEFSNIQPADVGDYRVIVANTIGSVTSAVATVTVIMPSAGSYEELVVSSEPIAFWRFNETSGSVAFDHIGGNDATYVSSAPGDEAPRPPGLPGFEAENRAIQLNGTDGYAMGPVGLVNDLTEFTMIGWMRRGADQADRTGLWGQNDIVEFGYINNNTLELWTDNGLDISPNPIPNGEWAQLAILFIAATSEENPQPQWGMEAFPMIK